jgi:phospholipid/cholesterol/gamma-HCH transport system permease protein
MRSGGTPDRRLGKVDDGGEPTQARGLPLWLRVPAKVGDTVVGLAAARSRFWAFSGRCCSRPGGLVRHPALPFQCAGSPDGTGRRQRAGDRRADELPGRIVIAQQGAVQLQQFGAEVYTVNLVGRLTLRELGILMTAIMVAGRSGSAFAAQLGTMKLNEEIDAMRTIGVSPMEALVLPRILATVLMLPVLGVYSAVVGIIGGAFLSSLTLDIPFSASLPAFVKSCRCTTSGSVCSRGRCSA